ncbi:MAG: DUF3830 family protein [Gemmatimonadaceae bacterium]
MTGTATLSIVVAERFRFVARLEEALAPTTCAAFRTLLPYRQRIVHARWSGEACWIPLGDFNLGVPQENSTSTPDPGCILWYPGGISETELLFPYGVSRFASRAGELAGNHFLTVTEGREQLAELGRVVLYEGAQEIVFREVS